jgi:cytochrome c1
LFRIMLAAMLLLPAAACKGEPDDRHDLPFADAGRGREAAMRAGCGACHALPGIGWPTGTVGPPLEGYAGRSLIAGELPNRPDILAAYIRNAPALVPGSAMPAMPVSAAEARDIAAFLYQSEAG